MDIEHKINKDYGYFVIGENEDALLGYRRNGDVLEINHTEVDEEFEGKGVGKSLVQAIVEYARKENLKIKPVCSFAKVMFEKNQEFSDVLAKGITDK